MSKFDHKVFFYHSASSVQDTPCYVKKAKTRASLVVRGLLLSLTLVGLTGLTGCYVKYDDEPPKKKPSSHQHQNSADSNQVSPDNTPTDALTQQSQDSALKDTCHCEQANQSESPNIPPIVSVETVKFVSVPQFKQFKGTTRPLEIIEVQPTATGTVNEIMFKQGYWTKVDEPLYRIDPQQYKASINTSKSAVKQAKAALASAQTANRKAKATLNTYNAILAQAEDDLARYEVLIADDAISEQTYQQALTNVQTARSSVRSTKALIAQTNADIKTAKANIELSKNQLEDGKQSLNQTVVTSPITGMVIHSDIHKGKKINPELDNASVIIAKINPILVDIQPTSDEMIQIQQALVTKIKQTKQAKKKENQKGSKVANNNRDVTREKMISEKVVKLVLKNGQTYAQSGIFKFNETKVVGRNTDADINTKTDTGQDKTVKKQPSSNKQEKSSSHKSATHKSHQNDNSSASKHNPTMRIMFANNKGLLKPNMEVTAKVEMPSLKNVVLLPPTAVMNTLMPSISTSYPKQPLKDVNHTQPADTSVSKDNKRAEKAKDEKNNSNRAGDDTGSLTLEGDAFSYFVYVVDDNHKIQRRAISIKGMYQKQIIVTDGLEVGDKVVIDSNQPIVNKQSVHILEEELEKLEEQKRTKATAEDNKAKSNSNENHKANRANNSMDNSSTPNKLASNNLVPNKHDATDNLKPNAQAK